MRVRISKEELEKVVGHSDFGGHLSSFVVDAEVAEEKTCEDRDCPLKFRHKEFLHKHVDMHPEEKCTRCGRADSHSHDVREEKLPKIEEVDYKNNDIRYICGRINELIKSENARRGY